MNELPIHKRPDYAEARVDLNWNLDPEDPFIYPTQIAVWIKKNKCHILNVGPNGECGIIQGNTFTVKRYRSRHRTGPSVENRTNGSTFSATCHNGASPFSETAVCMTLPDGTEIDFYRKSETINCRSDKSDYEIQLIW